MQIGDDLPNFIAYVFSRRLNYFPPFSRISINKREEEKERFLLEITNSTSYFDDDSWPKTEPLYSTTKTPHQNYTTKNSSFIKNPFGFLEIQKYA